MKKTGKVNHMEFTFTSIEARVMGALIEKQITTPDYYPLTLNALTAACNQKSNRDPVMNLDEKSVVRALEGLRDNHIVYQVRTVGSRAAKYEHNLKKVADFSPSETGAMCVLLLRGPQTGGEIRSRTGRLHKFDSLSEVEETLQQLMDRDDGPFTAKLPRRAGHKESRFMHLLCGEIDTSKEDEEALLEPAALEVRAENERISELEKKVDDLRAEMGELKQRFLEVAAQFD